MQGVIVEMLDYKDVIIETLDYETVLLSTCWMIRDVDIVQINVPIIEMLDHGGALATCVIIQYIHISYVQYTCVCDMDLSFFSVYR